MTSQQFQELAALIQQQSASIDGMNTKLDEWKKNLDTSINSVHQDLSGKINNLYEAVNNKFTHIENRLSTTNLRIDTLERQLIANDVIITGIPATNDEDVVAIIELIFKAIGFAAATATVINAVFRLPGKYERRPIIAKFVMLKHKIDFIKLCRKFNNLSLNHIGYLSPNPIFISECLTQFNREIFKVASAQRKKGDIAKVFTIRGQVHIRKTIDSNPVKILSTSELNYNGQ